MFENLITSVIILITSKNLPAILNKKILVNDCCFNLEA